MEHRPAVGGEGEGEVGYRYPRTWVPTARTRRVSDPRRPRLEGPVRAWSSEASSEGARLAPMTEVTGSGGFPETPGQGSGGGVR